MLLRVFMGWLHGKRGHCGTVAAPTIEDEEAKRPYRERQQIRRCNPLFGVHPMNPKTNVVGFLSVVIPFFQREEGLLRRAVESVLHQDFSGFCQILIVDDGSPISVEPEIQGLLISETTFSLKIIKQENSGVSAARNRALEAIDNRTDVVIFLDSDDTFTSYRFRTIQATFESGADFFFEDTNNPYDGRSSFERNGIVPGPSYPYTIISDGVYGYQGSPVDLLLPLGSFGANSMAYRWKGREHLRFEQEYASCDDVIFAARLMQISSNIAISTRLEVNLGKGVNISRGGEWGSEQRVSLLLNLCRTVHTIRHSFLLTDEQSQRIADDLARLDQSFIQNVAFSLVERRKAMARLISTYVVLRPQAILAAPKVIYSLVRARLSRQ